MENPTVADSGLNSSLWRDDALSRKERRGEMPRRNPGPAYCIAFLVICTAMVELLDGALFHLFGDYLSHNGLVALDILFMISILVPTYYYFVYRPIRLYDTERRRAEREVRHLSRQLLRARDEERRSLAREMYDQFGQSLSVLQFSMESLKASFDERHLVQLQQCNGMIDTISRLGNQVRNSSIRLRPPQLDDLGLIPAIEWAIDEIGRGNCHFSIDFNCRLLSGRLPPEVEQVLFISFREVMENVCEHAQAGRVDVSLIGTESMVCLDIADDGCGFDACFIDKRRGPKGIGLLGVRERVECLEGEFRVDTAPGAGTRIQVCVPRALRRREDIPAA